MGYHAKLSPSSAARWTSCTASIKAQEGMSDDGNEAARNGTCCHQIQAECLVSDTLEPADYLGKTMGFWSDIFGNSGEDWIENLKTDGSAFSHFIQHKVEVTQEMVDAVYTAIDFIRQVHATKGGTMEVEQRVPIGHFTGEEGATGTSDVTLIGDDWIHVLDSKYGRELVHAYDVIQPAGEDIITGTIVPEVVQGNLQMVCYALGSIEKFAAFGDFKHITLTIVQPFMMHVSEYSCDIDELLRLRDFLQAKAEETRTNPQFVPTTENCWYCKARGACEAQTKFVVETALVGFEDVETAAPKPINPLTLGSCYALVPMVQAWADAVVERTRQELTAGHTVQRSDGLSYKLVDGRKGNREWKDPEAAEKWLKNRRLGDDRIYTRKLVSPTKVEEFTKAPRAKKGEPPVEPLLSKLQWERLQALIRQGDGKPVIALSTDPRPAISTLDGFEDVPTADDDINGDLF